MSTPDRPLNDTEKTILSEAMDRLVPPIGDLPGAGTMGLSSEVCTMARQHPPYLHAISTFIERLVARRSVRLPDSHKDAQLRELEAAEGATFNAILELVYLAYYSDPRVHRRIGWRSGPLQPQGFPLASFNPEILQAVRKRQPFWRQD